ncbi:MAG: hypothetical protein AAFT19_01785 [Pseudomonadota bacterium]
MPAGAQDLSYDTESCRTDPGERLFVRLAAGYEFAFPVDVPTQLTSPVPDETGLPRDLTEPEGCPDNPVMMNGLHLRWDASLGDPEIGPLEEGWQVGDFFIRARIGELPNDLLRNPQMRTERGFRQLAVESVNPRAEVREINDDLLAVRITPKDEDRSWRDGLGYLAARSGAYEEPSGKRYVARCTGAIWPGGRQMCKVSYGLSCDLLVVYKFWTDDVPVKHALNLDRQIRAMLRRHALRPGLLDPERPC